MSNETAASCDILIKNVPGDIVQELGRRAEAHFRSRSGEITAILAAVCRSDATLPGLGVGEALPTLRGTDGVNQDRGSASARRCRFTDANGYCTNEAMQGGGFKCTGLSCGGRVELEVGV